MRREILRLAVPAFLALVAEPLFLLGDSAIVGHLGTVPLAGLSVAAAVLSTAAGVFVFLAYGTTGVVARHLGAGSDRLALAAGADGLWLALVLGVAAASVVAGLAGPMAGAFGGSAAASAQAVTYLRIAAAGVPGMLVVLAATGVMRGLQDTRTPLLVSVVGFAANLVLNVVLVFGARMGIAGSATGTVLAQTGMAAGLVTVMLRQSRRLGATLRFRPAGVLRVALAGLPLLVRTLALRAVLLVTTAVAAGYGDVTLAGHQVVLSVWNFLAFALDALAIAAQAIVGRALGAGDRESAHATATTLTWWGVATGAVVGVVLLAVSPVLARLFTADDRVVRAAAVAFVVVGAVQWLAGYVFVLDGILIGAGDNTWLAVLMCAAVAVFVPLLAWQSRGAHVLPGSFGVPLVGLWVWYAAGFMALRGIGLGWRFRSGRWLVTGTR